MTRLPFEVLPTDDGRPLIDNFQLSYLSSARDVVHFDRATPVGEAMVVADPDFDLADGTPIGDGVTAEQRRQSRDMSRGGIHFGRLPGTRAEGEQIGALLGVRPLLDREALEGHLKACRSPAILHIASHGFFIEDQQELSSQRQVGPSTIDGSATDPARLLGSAENPLLRSGLALAGANARLAGRSLPTDAEDGLLTAEDASVLNLFGTELVVLSARETGLGEVHVGEGVLGLRRSFALAGARTLIMSLWKVPDAQTQELMVDFYQRLLNGASRLDALRGAQLSLRTKHPEPYYWGAFVCRGKLARSQTYPASNHQSVRLQVARQSTEQLSRRTSL